MDWKTLFLDANGRIGQRDFWIGAAILFVSGIVLNFIPVIGQIAAILMIYPWVCVCAKRLHDFGKSGWLVLVPVGVDVVVMIIAAVVGGASLMAASGAAGAGGAAAGVMAGAGLVMLLGLAALVVGIGFLLWIGLTKGEIGPNRYGPPPVALVGGSVTPA